MLIHSSGSQILYVVSEILMTYLLTTKGKQMECTEGVSIQYNSVAEKNGLPGRFRPIDGLEETENCPNCKL